MIAPLAKFIDWYALQVAAMVPSIRKCARGNSKLTEAVEFLNGPDFIPAESKPAELEFTSNTRFTFPSPRTCEFAENIAWSEKWPTGTGFGSGLMETERLPEFRL